MTCAAASNRTPPATAATPAIRYGIRRVLRRRRDRLSVKARGRLDAGLITGDPTGETTLAWTVAHHLMACY